jgi:hypothetical protein
METKSVWLTRGGVKCGDCGHSFTSPCMCGDSANLWYGEFVFYAKDGSLIYWNAYNDSTYNNYQKLLDSILIEHPNFPRYGIGMSLAILFDPPLDGSVYKSVPYCPACKSDNTHYRTLEVGSDTLRIPIATFTHWNSLTELQQRQIIVDELEQVTGRQPLGQRANLSQPKTQSEISGTKPPVLVETVRTIAILRSVLSVIAVLAFFAMLGVLLLVLFPN